MVKRYISKKDLPDAKAGAIFKLGFGKNAYFLKSEETETKYNCYAYPVAFVENSPDWFEEVKEVVKPPLGARPLRIHNELRVEELRAAIERYNDAGMIAPSEWFSEMQSLQASLQYDFLDPPKPFSKEQYYDRIKNRFIDAINVERKAYLDNNRNKGIEILITEHHKGMGRAIDAIVKTQYKEED